MPSWRLWWLTCCFPPCHSTFKKNHQLVTSIHFKIYKGLLWHCFPGQSLSRSIAMSMSTPPSGPPPEPPVGPQVQATYAHMPQQDCQLAFNVGDLITLLGEQVDGWQFGHNIHTGMWVSKLLQFYSSRFNNDSNFFLRLYFFFFKLQQYTVIRFFLTVFRYGWFPLSFTERLDQLRLESRTPVR